MVKKKNPWLFAGFGMLVIILLAASIFLFVSSSSSYHLSSEYFQIGAGVKISYKSGTKLVYSKEKTADSKAKDNEVLSTSPLYKTGSKSFLLPRDLIYVNAREKQFFRADHFTKFSFETGEVNVDEKPLVSKGFLYDGSQQYVFLESMTIHINGVEKELAAGSSVYISTSSNAYILYDIETDTIELDMLYTQSMQAKCNDYSVDLFRGVLDAQGKKILLYSQSDDLESL